MKKTDLENPGAGRAQQLTKLAREINDREEVIGITQGQACHKTSEWLCEVALQGQTLLRVKELLKHGDFMPWITSHCPLISTRTARHYMRIASKWQRVAKIEGVKSLRAALALCCEQEEAGDPEATGVVNSPKSWPPFLEGIGRFGKFADYLERNPVTSWPLEGKEKLREKMLPIAATLWPEKFD